MWKIKAFRAQKVPLKCPFYIYFQLQFVTFRYFGDLSCVIKEQQL